MINELDVTCMALSRVIFYLTVIIFLSTFSAQCENQASISFDQQGMGEPFESGRSVAYHIHIQPLNAMAIKTIELEVGPDSNNMAISKKFSAGDLSLYLKQGESKDFRFEVNFQSPEFRQGDFGKWLSDKNETGVWDRAWYQAKISQVIGEPIILENYEGHPRLFKPFEEFRNARVSPSKGTNQSAYSYEVEVQSNSNDTVLMKVSPSQNGPWTDKGSQKYSNVGTWQKLVWDNISLDFDFNTAYYKFIGRKESEKFGGPSWPVNYAYQNASVDPARGLPESLFTYGLDFKAEKKLNVELNVWDISSRMYKSEGMVPYENVSQWARLVWPEISLTEDMEARGSSNYYFSFYYLGSEKPISTTKEEAGAYAGPEIVPIELKNATVVPFNGSLYFTDPLTGPITDVYTYTYTADIYKSQANGPVEIRLEVYDPVAGRWLNGGLQTIDPGMTNLTYSVNFANFFKNLFLGETKYRFISNDIVIGEYSGPDIDVNFKNESHIEAAGAKLTYQVEVRSSLPNVPIALAYTTDNNIWQLHKDKRIYESNASEWKVLAWNAYPRYYSYEFEALREQV